MTNHGAAPAVLNGRQPAVEHPAWTDPPTIVHPPWCDPRVCSVNWSPWPAGGGDWEGLHRSPGRPVAAAAWMEAAWVYLISGPDGSEPEPVIELWAPPAERGPGDGPVEYSLDAARELAAVLTAAVALA